MRDVRPMPAKPSKANTLTCGSVDRLGFLAAFAFYKYHNQRDGGAGRARTEGWRMADDASDMHDIAVT